MVVEAGRVGLVAGDQEDGRAARVERVEDADRTPATLDP